MVERNVRKRRALDYCFSVVFFLFHTHIHIVPVYLAAVAAAALLAAAAAAMTDRLGLASVATLGPIPQ